MKIISTILLLLFPLVFTNDGTTLFVPEGLEIELWAESPMLYNPTNMDVDARGRIWVTEAVEYRDFNNKPETRFNYKNQGDRIVILEDIIDTGKTLHHYLPQLDSMQPASVKIAVLLNKKEALQYPVQVHYTCFDIPNKFVVGYGLDYDGLGRNSKDIYQLKA